MLTKAAEKHFGGRAGIYGALKPRWSKPAVYQWGRVVPLFAAITLERLSSGKCRVNLRLYKNSGHAKSATAVPEAQASPDAPLEQIA